MINSLPASSIRWSNVRPLLNALFDTTSVGEQWVPGRVALDYRPVRVNELGQSLPGSGTLMVREVARVPLDDLPSSIGGFFWTSE